MGKFVDLTGKRFNRLLVLRRTENYVDKRGVITAQWVCLCDCGKEKVLRTGDLTTGHYQSCGCLNRERLLQSHTKHGLGKTRIYHIYLGMMDRCYDEKNCSSYKYYGGRGITVCDEWHGGEGAKRFKEWAIKNGYKDGLTLDRIDCNGNYTPDNCRWVTYKTQNNNKRDNHYITIGEETKTAKQWADQVGMNYTTLLARLSHGWNVEEAVFTPIDMRFSHKPTPNLPVN